jgi:hypothetical protein
VITAWAFNKSRLDLWAQPVVGTLWTSPAGITWFTPEPKQKPLWQVRRYRMGQFVFYTEDAANKARVGRAARELANPFLGYLEFKNVVDTRPLHVAVAGHKKIFKNQR